MRKAAIVTIALVVAAGSLPATAETVKFIGCPVRAVEGCLIVRNGPIVYNISSAQPAPRVGTRAIRVTAEISGSIGLCFAKPLGHIRWHYLRQRCARSGSQFRAGPAASRSRVRNAIPNPSASGG